MNLNIKVNADFVMDVIDDYCRSHVCPKGCPFDHIGICTEANPFNTISERYGVMKAKDEKNA